MTDGRLPSALETRLGEQHRAFLGDLHEGLVRQGDRVIARGAGAADRLRATAAAGGQLAAAMDQLTRSVNERLEAISGKVNERLDEGFRKTNVTFDSVMARLATIEEAEKKIDGLTSNVVSLQELLGDKRSRGAFGEVHNVTSDRAVMFVPAEAVFAEIHAYHGEVVSYAQHKRVWIVSPTTLMAVLNTARAVLKDVETRRQIHVIKDALGKLSKDFARFDERMRKLATHIKQAHDDVRDVQISSRKITGQFQRIEGVELDGSLPQVGYRQSQE